MEPKSPDVRLRSTRRGQDHHAVAVAVAADVTAAVVMVAVVMVAVADINQRYDSVKTLKKSMKGSAFADPFFI